jgi:folate-binding protein YgfZ
MSDMASQYRIIAAGAGWARKPARGRLRFGGADRMGFLQALLTNEIAALPAGGGTYALYLTPQGRLIADLHVFVRPDVVIADVPAGEAWTLTKAFDGLIFAEEVTVTDESASLRQVSVVGSGAAATIALAFGASHEAVRDLPLWFQFDVPGGFVARTDDVPEGSWDVIAGAAEGDAAIEALTRAGAVAVSDEILEAIRIESGRPAFGVDMTHDTIPLEAGLLDRAISQSKGCYPGQEVIVRVLHRGGGRVARRLVRFACDDNCQAPPMAGATIAADGRDVGHVTSASRSARSGRPIALGYVARDFAEADRRVRFTWADGACGGVILA